MHKSAIKELLMAGNFLAINKTIMQKLGLETAVLLSSFAEADRLGNDGWFYQTIATVEKHTTLSRHKQDRCINELKDLGILETDVHGVPAKRYFKINYSKLSAYLFESNQQASLQEIDKLECKELTTNKEITNKEIRNKEITNKYSASKESTTDINNFFEDMWKLYPNKKNKGQVSKSKKKEIYKLGDEFERCIERYIKDVEEQRVNGFTTLRYKNGSTFFNSGYVDYLDKNYQDTLDSNKANKGGNNGYKGGIAEDKTESGDEINFAELAGIKEF